MNVSWVGVEGLLPPLGLGDAQRYLRPGHPHTAAAHMGDLGLHVAKSLSQQKVKGSLKEAAFPPAFPSQLLIRGLFLS